MPGPRHCPATHPPATAVAVVVLGRGRVLFGRRCAGDGGSVWQLPGGWIEPGESALAAARREVREETGLELGPLRQVATLDNGLHRGRRSVSAVFEARCADSSRLAVNEPDKNTAWEWHRWDEIDDGLFAPLRRLKRSGYRPPSAGEPGG